MLLFLVCQMKLFLKRLLNIFIFLVLRTVEDYERLSDYEKAIYTNYFKVFTMQKRNLLTIDKDIEQMFISRMREMNELKRLSQK